MKTDSPEIYEFQKNVEEPLVNETLSKTKCTSNPQRTTGYLYFVAVVSSISQITVGLMLAWLSPIVAQLRSTDSNINPLTKPMTTLELSSIGTSQAVGFLLGPLVIGALIDRFGRRRTIIALCLNMTISLVILAHSTIIIMFFVSQFVIGICCGGIFVALPIYASELAEDHNRGIISCLVMTGSPLGSAISFVTGPYLSIKAFTLICAIPVALNVIFFSTILPESPVQLVKLKDVAGAKIVLQNLRRKVPRDIEDDIKRIESELKIRCSLEDHGGCSNMFRDRSSRNGIIVATVVFNLIILNGTLPLIGYLQLIFDQTESDIPSNICAFLSTIVQLLSFVGSSFVIDMLGRRTLILFSTVFSIIPLVMISVFFHLKYEGYESVKDVSLFPVVVFVMFSAVSNFGNSSVPFALMCELFTNEVKASATSFIVFTSGLSLAVFTFLIPIIMESLGIHWCFWFFTGNSVICSIFVYFLVPETKGKTLLEIQEMLKNLI